MPLSDAEVISVDTNRRAVLFTVFNGQDRINCAVSFEAMDDAERARNVAACERRAEFERLRGRIVEAAARKHFPHQPPGEVLVTGTDLRNQARGVVR